MTLRISEMTRDDFGVLRDDTRPAVCGAEAAEPLAEPLAPAPQADRWPISVYPTLRA